MRIQKEEEEEFVARLHVQQLSTYTILCNLFLGGRRGRIGGPDVHVCRREHST